MTRLRRTRRRRKMARMPKAAVKFLSLPDFKSTPSPKPATPAHLQTQTPLQNAMYSDSGSDFAAFPKTPPVPIQVTLAITPPTSTLTPSTALFATTLFSTVTPTILIYYFAAASTPSIQETSTPSHDGA